MDRKFVETWLSHKENWEEITTTLGLTLAQSPGSCIRQIAGQMPLVVGFPPDVDISYYDLRVGLV